MDDLFYDAARRALFATVGSRNQAYPKCYALGLFLKRYVAATAVIDGCPVAPLSSKLGLRCSAAIDPETQRRNGVRSFACHDAYEEAVMRAGGPAHACADPELLHRVVPEDWVPAVASLIEDGPRLGVARSQAAILDFSREEVPANRRRETGRRSRATVRIVLGEATRLLRAVYGLRSHPACEAWTYMPTLAMPEMPKGGYVPVAPRVETVRQSFEELTSEVHRRLGVSRIEEELGALDALTNHAVSSRGLWRPARDRAVLTLIVLTGGRRDAIARLCRMDYKPDHEGPAPDCRRGAVLDLRPRKGKGREEVRRKPIPRQASLTLELYLAVLDRMRSEKGHLVLGPDAPLVVAEPTLEAKAVSPNWLYLRLGGTSAGRRPLVPRDVRHMPKHLTEAERGLCGYSTHEYRHFANQLAERAGELWNERFPATGGEANPPSSYYAAALLDNGGAERDMRALYGDRRTPAMLEVVSGRAAEIGWEILSTGTGLRKRPNVEAYEQELIRLRRIEDEERRLEQRAQCLQGQRVPQLEAAGREVQETDRLDVIMHRQEDLIRSVRELRELLLESSAITHQLVQLSREKADTIKKLDLYRLDRATWLPVADSEPPGAERVDWEAIDKGKLGKPLMPLEAPSAVRDWLTFREFCEVIGLQARSTLTRWAKGEHLPARPDRRPWEPDRVPVDASLGVNYRRIWVPGVNETFWRTRLRREELANKLSRWPREQGWTTKDGEPTPRCLEPIRVSAPRLQAAA